MSGRQNSVMDLPQFVPNFIKLDNQRSETSESHLQSMFWEEIEPRLARGLVSQRAQTNIKERYWNKCNEYFGPTVDNAYFTYRWHEAFSSHFFPDESLADSDPDPVYSGVFGEYFMAQKTIREHMIRQNVPITDQIVCTIDSISRAFSEKLAKKRKLAALTHGTNSGVESQKGDGNDTPATEIDGVDCDDDEPGLVELKGRIEKTITDLFGEDLESNWVLVRDDRDDEWVLVEREKS